MAKTSLKTFSESVQKMMREKNITLKELARKSAISYSSLTPIIHGRRDCSVLKLIAIANAMNCSVDILLNELLSNPCRNNSQVISHTKIPLYLTVFISQISMTYCLFYEVESKQEKTIILPYNFGCGQNAEEFMERILGTLHESIPKYFSTKPRNESIAVFVSVQQYEGTNNRERIENNGGNLFANFILESDVVTNYRALFGNKNGICVTINDGSVILYSTNSGKSFIKNQGYGFPIADTAGNEWIGCEAIKYVINVKEQVAQGSILSDKILALFHDNIDTIAESAMVQPANTYKKVSAIVKELMHIEPTAFNIIEKSANLLLQRIKIIDQATQTTLPIAVAGDLAEIYKEFFPKNRLITMQQNLSVSLLNHGLTSLKRNLNKRGSNGDK